MHVFDNYDQAAAWVRKASKGRTILVLFLTVNGRVRSITLNKVAA